jgi:hypothetical protein
VPNLEGNAVVHQLVCEHPDAPNVRFGVVRHPLHDLRRGVERSPTLGIAHQRAVNCPPEIANLDSILVQKDILWLEVPVDYVMLVHVLRCDAQLPHPLTGLCLGNRSMLAEIVIEVAIETSLHY